MSIRHSQFAYSEQLSALVEQDTRWLELGCGHQIIPRWMPNSRAIQAELVRRCALVVGIDVDLRPHTAGIGKVAGDIENLPFADGAFSLVSANMVVEHLRNPEPVLREVRRVLRPGGKFLFHTPNSLYPVVAVARVLPRRVRSVIAHRLDGRNYDDIFPTYYRLNSRRRIERLAVKCGLRVLTANLVQTAPQFATLGSLLLKLERLFLQLVSRPKFSHWRSNLIAVLAKP